MTGIIDRQKARPAVLFQIGGLRFGVHGLLGVLSLGLTEAARRSYDAASGSSSTPDTPDASIAALLVLALSQLCNALLATHAASLLPQVPAYTQIIPAVVAPHKEAFVRTMACMHYLVVRVLCKYVVSATTTEPWAAVGCYASLACLALPYWPLVPSYNRTTLANGNTWIFVVPIFVGVTGDLVQFIAWGDCISMSQLLQVQLVGLLLAFGFTLAFRNYIPMPLVYFLAAWRVWEIIREGYATVLQAASVASAL
jgi:hypothetical protein